MMMRILIVQLFVVFGVSMAFAADPLEGTWQTIPDDNGHFGHVAVAPCGDKLCGTLVRAYDEAGQQTESENIGRLIISETVLSENGTYRGKVYSPDRDRTYNSRLVLDGDRLNVRGCVLGICRDGGTWQRVN